MLAPKKQRAGFLRYLCYSEGAGKEDTKSSGRKNSPWMICLAIF